jgi:hypothetical protein
MARQPNAIVVRWARHGGEGLLNIPRASAPRGPPRTYGGDLQRGPAGGGVVGPVHPPPQLRGPRSSLRASAQCSASWPDGSTRLGLEPTATTTTITRGRGSYLRARSRPTRMEPLFGVRDVIPTCRHTAGEPSQCMSVLRYHESHEPPAADDGCTTGLPSQIALTQKPKMALAVSGSPGRQTPGLPHKDLQPNVISTCFQCAKHYPGRDGPPASP